MNDIMLWANPGNRLVRCLRQLTSSFQRNRLYVHRSQACDQKRCAKSVAIDFSVDLPSRFIDPKPRKQSRKFLVADTTPRHFYLYQLLRGLLPNLIRPNTLFWQSVHRISPPFPLLPQVANKILFSTIFSRIRLIGNRQHYTSSEHLFFGDRVQERHSSGFFGYRTPLEGGQR